MERELIGTPETGQDATCRALDFPWILALPRRRAGQPRPRVGPRLWRGRLRQAERLVEEPPMPDNGREPEAITYDELRGPDLDAARWEPMRLPLPTGDEHIPVDPNAELAVGEGEVRVTIPRFSLSHDEFQAADSVKYLTQSVRQFELPADRPVTFAADLAVENIGGEPTDFRRGIAARSGRRP